VTRGADDDRDNAGSGEGVGATAGVASDVVWLVGSSYSAQIVSLFLSIGLRRVLGPASMGFVAMSQLVASYAPFLTLGIAQAAEREIAIAIGSRRLQVAERLEGTTAAVAVGLGFVVAAGAFLASGWVTHPGTAQTIAASGAIVFFQQLAIWATIRLRTRYRFRALGIWGAVGSVLTITLTLLGALVGGLPWALGGSVAGSALQAVLLARAARLARPQFSATSLRRLAPMAPGFLAMGLSAVVLNSVDQIAVAGFLGPTALGLYSAAYLGNAFLVRVPNLVGSVIYPRLQRDLGAHGEIPRLHVTVRRTTEATLVAMGPLIAVMFVGLPLLTRLVLPAFVTAIPPMRLLLVGVAGLALAVPASQMLATIDRLWRQVAITTMVVLAMASVYGISAAAGAMSLDAAALVDMVAYSLYGVILQVVAARAAGGGTAWLVRPLIVIAVPLLSLTATAIAWDTQVARPGLGPILVGTALQTVAFGLPWIILARSYLRNRPTEANDLRSLLANVLHRLRWPR
jgi:O-antigen/teichoic acid export membrane protein